MGKTFFAALNLITSAIMILGSVGFMFGADGSALVSKTMGEGKPDKARSLFSLLVYCTVAGSIVIAGMGFLFIRPIASLLGAEGALLEDSIRLSVVVAEFISASMTVLFLAAKKKRYHY